MPGISFCKKDNTAINYFQFQINDTTYKFDDVEATVDTSSAYITTIEAKNTKTGSHVEDSTTFE